jgi:purine-nucleoside phosphorylase
MMNHERLAKGAARLAARLESARGCPAAILGSGWSSVVEELDWLEDIRYSEIPELGSPGVAGHSGRLLVAGVGEGRVLLFAGRRHWYEGAGWEPVAFPVRLCVELQSSSLLITNAAGGIRPELRAGSLMVIRDHINLMGDSPLAGPHSGVWGSRFPSMTGIYDAGLGALLTASAADAMVSVSTGVYAAVCGPCYETPAEMAALRSLGADAVGMSTVPEAMLAHAAGLKLCGVSCITNSAGGQGKGPTHDEVLAVAGRTASGLASTLKGYWRRLAAPVAAG